MAKYGTTRLFSAIATGAAAVLMLAGCVNFTPLDDLREAKPPGTAFELALFKNYAFLAHSFGDIGAANDVAFDQEGSMSLAQTDSEVAALANTFAAKALQLSNGLEVDPEPSRDLKAHTLRDRLVRALTPGRDTYPRDAARAQADYDCWILNATVASQGRASEQCRRSFDVTLTQLENDVQVTPQTPAPESATPAPATPAPAPAPSPSASAQPSAYTVYFDFDSWGLTASAVSVLQQAVADARTGGQSKIAVVGHADTAGEAGYNMRLSLRRADAVRNTLVDLGARREAIETSGVGETDLAVQTGDGVREPKNRRSAIALVI